VVTLILLFLSLGSTTASVLLAILAKQVLYLYALAVVSASDAEKGVPDTKKGVSDTEKGQNRQSRLTRFMRISQGIVFGLYTVLLFALLLFDGALIAQNWEASPTISILIICGTSCIAPVFAIFLLLSLANLGIFNFSSLKNLLLWERAYQ